MPGFLFGRRHEATAASSALFNYYVVESPAVLTSKPCFERQSDTDDQAHHVGRFQQHASDGLPARGAAPSALVCGDRTLPDRSPTSLG